MNHIGTHDTARILTVLASNINETGDRRWQSEQTLSSEQYADGVRLLRLAAVLQFTLPGVPSVYYGDEAGLTGYGDPFCRAGYPWGRENGELIDFYKTLGQFRRSSTVFASGDFIPVYAQNAVFSFVRKKGKNAVLTAVNSGNASAEIEIPSEYRGAKPVFGGKAENGRLKIEPRDFAILVL